MAMRLLIVETDGLFRRNISDRLRLEKYSVFEACSESEAERIFTRVDIDVVLLGLGRLKRDGLALLKRIKKFRPATEVILMIPAEDHSLSVSIEGMKSGAFDDLLVPFDMETLLDRTQAACRQKRTKEKGGKPSR